MRRLISIVGVTSVLFILSAAVAPSQDQKQPPGKGEPKAAEKPETPAKTAPKEDMHALLNQFENVSRALHASEQAAIEGDPALQAEREAILDEIQQTVEKIRAFEEKVDDKVIAKSPESQQLVQEKRELANKLEDFPQAKKGGLMGMGRLLKWIYGDKAAGRGKGEHRGKGAGKK